MKVTSRMKLGAIALSALAAAALPASAQEQKQPNVLFIMGDDIGWMQPSIYHRGLMVGETPNIDRIGHEGMMFTDYYAMQSMHLGSQRLRHRHVPAAHGANPAATPGQPDLSETGHTGDRSVPA